MIIDHVHNLLFPAHKRLVFFGEIANAFDVMFAGFDGNIIVAMNLQVLVLINFYQAAGRVWVTRPSLFLTRTTHLSVKHHAKAPPICRLNTLLLTRDHVMLAQPRRWQAPLLTNMLIAIDSFICKMARMLVEFLMAQAVTPLPIAGEAKVTPAAL